MKVHNYKIEGIPVKTGDLICTTDGDYTFTSGQFWRLIGKFIPGEVDHIVIYIGPDGKCIEAGLNGVISFDAKDGIWNSHKMQIQRGTFIDSLYGIAYPLKKYDLIESEENQIRLEVANYCLQQIGKTYNLNFFDSRNENAFYCSQLAYLAYLKNNIDLNTNSGVQDIPGTNNIIFPQEIWSGCAHKKYEVHSLIDS